LNFLKDLLSLIFFGLSLFFPVSLEIFKVAVLRLVLLMSYFCE
jgi:hypothetical protein